MSGRETTAELMRQLGAMVGVNIDSSPVQRMVLELDVSRMPKLYVQLVPKLDEDAKPLVAEQIELVEGPVVVNEKGRVEVMSSEGKEQLEMKLLDYLHRNISEMERAKRQDHLPAC